MVSLLIATGHEKYYFLLVIVHCTLSLQEIYRYPEDLFAFPGSPIAIQMAWSRIIIVGVLLVCSVAKVKCQMLLTTTNPEPILGSSVTLSCRITKPNGYPVQWTLSNQQVGSVIIATTHMLTDCSKWFVDDKAYYRWETCEKSVAGAASQDFNITVIKTRIRDTGHWFCSEMNGNIRKAIYIKVGVPPGPPTITGFGEVPYDKTGHTLTCSATRTGVNDPITYQWFKDGKVVSTSATWTLGKTTAADSGTYKCKATNKYGSTEKSGDLKVTAKAVLTASPKQVLDGGRVTVTCEFIGGDPLSSLTITSSGSRWTTKTGPAPRVVYESPVRRDDSTITCTASVAGKTKSVTNFKLDIIYPPTLTTSITPATIVEYRDDAHLTCTAKGGFPDRPSNAAIAWFYNGKELLNKAGYNLPLTINKPGRTRGGEYRCRATNYGGLYVWTSIQLNVHYPPEWDPAFPKSTTATGSLSKSAVFTLHAVSNPKPTKVAWLKEVPNMVYDPKQPAPSLGYYFQANMVDEHTYRLHLWRISSSDYGKYRAYVTNDAGTQHFTFTLLKPGRPYPPCCINVTLITSVAVTLTFKGNQERGSEQKVYEIQYRKVDKTVVPWNTFPRNVTDSGSSGAITQKIANLKSTTKYQFRVRSYNSFGESAYLGTVFATTRALLVPTDPKITVNRSGDVAIVTWPKVIKGIRVEVMACPEKGVCKPYIGTNVSKIGIPVAGMKGPKFFLRYYDGADVAYETARVPLPKVQPPSKPFPGYAFGIIGFVVGILTAVLFILILWKVRCGRYRRQRDEPEAVSTVTRNTAVRNQGPTESPYELPVYTNGGFQYDQYADVRDSAPPEYAKIMPVDGTYVNLPPIETEARPQGAVGHVTSEDGRQTPIKEVRPLHPPPAEATRIETDDGYVFYDPETHNYANSP